MRNRRLSRDVGLLIAVAMSTALFADRATAQWTVIDPSNLAQNVAQVARAIQQINNQRLQIQYQLQALQKLPTHNWRDIRYLVHQLDVLMQQGQALAYSLANLDAQFQQTFPGGQVAISNLALSESQRVQSQRTLGTMRAALNVLSEQSRQFAGGQARLASIKTQMSAVRGTQEALELQSTLDAFLAEEVGLLRQTLAAQANMQAVYNAYVVNTQAETRANFRAMMDRMSQLPPPSQRTFSLMRN
jgi:P-type conjugative transfer protein TrbJ